MLLMPALIVERTGDFEPGDLIDFCTGTSRWAQRDAPSLLYSTFQSPRALSLHRLFRTRLQMIVINRFRRPATALNPETLIQR